MKGFIKPHEWQIIEEGFNPENNRISESLFSLGNGRMGQRANFEETYSGDSHQGSYVAGVYYSDKTRVGWWKNGYPEYFAKVLNAPNWIQILIKIENQELDLAHCETLHFQRILYMKEGLLCRTFTAALGDGKQVKVEAERFCSMADGETGAIRYSITPVNFSGTLTFTLPVDGDVTNKDSNYGEKFWNPVTEKAENQSAVVICETKKTQFQVGVGMTFELEGATAESRAYTKEQYAHQTFQVRAEQNQTITLYKYAAVLSSENHGKETLLSDLEAKLSAIARQGYENLKAAHAGAWAKKWEGCDIAIKGDMAAQQGIRFNIFQLTQTYTGDDERLNIGPKGFTGEKYGGGTYWDTEAYCLPFFLSTAPPQTARNLLMYRYKHLPKAIENAAKLGFSNGAALYPMVTMNGEECHNEWEITFEEIHRNGAIAFAIYDYVRYTGDEEYLLEYGLETLIAISRFWAQRTHFSQDKKKYVILGVTGPNEYENNVNNNWYTNYIARWTLQYTVSLIDNFRKTEVEKWEDLERKLGLENREVKKWRDIEKKMYFPQDKFRGIFLQQDGFLDKEIIPVKKLPRHERPLNQKWSWDRILRSCYIKQADVLQGIYLFEGEFDKTAIKRNFDFYEQLTVHESSLSPCVHVILACSLGYKGKAYELYLRTSRLDLDNYNRDTEDGCHITSMAGAWMSVIKGFGGMRVANGSLFFNAVKPKQWEGFSFRVNFRGRVLKVEVAKKKTTVTKESGDKIAASVNGKWVTLL